MISYFAIILTSFNRKCTTLRCLGAMFEQKYDAKMDVYLCDDASTDGTSEAVREQYPHVHIVKGTGHLFWNRGMLRAWESAKATKDYDAYIWLNDDVVLFPNALKQLLETSEEQGDKAILCGEFCSSQGTFSYGGKDKDYRPIIPNGSCQPLYLLNGNCVLVPRSAVEKIGLLDPMFLHGTGDFDYGLRALAAGIPVLTTKQYIGECEENPNAACRQRKDGLSLMGRFKRLYSPFGYHPIVAFHYVKRHWGLMQAIRMFLRLHYQNLLPDAMYHKTIKE